MKYPLSPERQKEEASSFYVSMGGKDVTAEKQWERKLLNKQKWKVWRFSKDSQGFWCYIMLFYKVSVFTRIMQ